MARTFFLSLRPRKLPLQSAVHHRSLGRAPRASRTAAHRARVRLLAVEQGHRRPSGPVLTTVTSRAWLTRRRRWLQRRCCIAGWPVAPAEALPPLREHHSRLPWRSVRTGIPEVEDDLIYDFAIMLFILRSLIVLTLFQFVPVALVSCRRDLRSRVISFYIICL